jgi:UDP-glucose 4-epimerase
MQYLITGAAGFLGAALANRLVHSGHNVRGLDDLSTGNPESLIPDVHFTRGDINDRPKLWSLLQGVDCVYHLAARVVVPESILYPREYNQVNVGGTVALMEAMRDVGVRRVIFISSGALYGDQQEQPIRETSLPAPRSPYAVSKLAAEYYIRTIGSLWGLETVCLRVFNAYGPGQHIPPVHAPVIPYFLHQAATRGTIVIHGDGNQSRDYIFLEDVVDGMVSASSIQGIDHAIINLGSGRETTVRDLMRLVLEITGGKPEVVYNSRSDRGPSRMCADVSLAREQLGFQPKMSLEAGIRNTFERDQRLRNRNAFT